MGGEIVIGPEGLGFWFNSHVAQKPLRVHNATFTRQLSDFDGFLLTDVVFE